MTDDELNLITGQAGIVLTPEDVVAFDLKDAALFSAIPETPQISLADLVLGSSILADNPGVEIDNATRQIAAGSQVYGVNLTFKDLVVEIDKMETDLRLGKESLGIIGIYGFRSRISGNVLVFSKP
jgi:hypothetical protein